jgi:inner membrane protein
VASLGHVAVGLAGGRVFSARAGASAFSWKSALLWSALSLLPDLDAIGLHAGIPYGAPFGHRGASHALLVALLIGVLAALLAPLARWPARRTGLFVTFVVGSHGLLDAMTDGGKGIALAWPFSHARMFLPWRPIPVAPIGAGMLSQRGLDVLVTELVYFAPLLLWALWPRSRSPKS